MNNHTDIVSALLYDGERLVQEFFPAISVSALQVYFTALPFTPVGTEIYNTYKRQMEGAVMVQGELPKQWSACVQVVRIAYLSHPKWWSCGETGEDCWKVT